MNNKSVRPRDAAVMILIRSHGRRREVLMGRRSKKSRFMPDVYVFPGGGVDRDDNKVQIISEIDASIIKHMSVAGRMSLARRLAIAAVRETFEETGLMVGAPGDVGHLDHPVWNFFREQRCAPDLSNLHYIGRAITPTFLATRFHARFFLHEVFGDLGQLGGDGELVDLQWISMCDALQLPLADATEFMLRHVGDLVQSNGRIPRYPLFIYKRYAPWIQYAQT